PLCNGNRIYRRIHSVPLPGLRRRLLVGARAAEDIPHGIVPLVTGVLEDFVLSLVALERYANRPRFRKRRGIIDRHGVRDRIRPRSRESLDQAQRFARASEVGLVGEVGDLDDERVALPVTAWITQVLTDALADVRTAINRDDACLVNHLVREHDVARTLHDPEDVAVAARVDHDMRPTVTRDDTAIAETAIGPGIGRTAAASGLGSRCLTRARLRRQWRHAAVGRIDDF